MKFGQSDKMKMNGIKEKIIYPYPIEEIIWLDAQSSMENWFIEEIKEKLEPIQSKSIGYLIHETKTYIILGFLMFSDEMCKHHQLIPKGMILKRNKIRGV